MKIAIISDVHDNAHNLVMALDEIYKNKEIEKIIFLGDFAGAAIANLLCSSQIPVFAIWGNNDGDKALITKFSLKEGSKMEIGLDVFDTLEIDSRKLFLSHYPTLAMPMAKSGEFDAVFYGHDHTKHKERVDDCLVINPGEIGAYKTGEATFAIYNTKTNDAEEVVVPNCITTNTPESQKRFEEINYKFNQQKSHKL